MQQPTHQDKGKSEKNQTHNTHPEKTQQTPNTKEEYSQVVVYRQVGNVDYHQQTEQQAAKQNTQRFKYKDKWLQQFNL